MTVRKIAPILVVFCLAALIVPAADGSPKLKKTYGCVRLQREPVLDGKVRDDAAWDGTLRAGDFSRLLVDKAPSRETFFRMAYTSKALLVAVECAEPTPGNIRAEAEDMGSLWGEDSVEVFILPPGKEQGLQFIVSAIGSRWNGTGNGKELSLGQWQAKTCIGEDFWSVEIRIPWEVLGAVPKEGDRWAVNVCRNILSAGDHEYATWADLERSFHEPANFQEVVFAGAPDEKEIAAEPELAEATAPAAQAAATEQVLLFSKPLEGTFLQRGRKRTRITFRHGPYVAPRLSPDGKTILLHSRRGGKIGIWLSDETGERMERICDGEQAEWSPDGTKIIFVRKGAIIERQLAAADEVDLTPPNVRACSFPSYLPDGRIAFVTKDGPRGKLALLDRTAPEEPEVMLEGEIESAPRCSPDGVTIACQNGAHIYLVNLKDKQVSQLTTAGGVQAWPVWSLDGESLTYCQAVDPLGPWDIYNVEIANPSSVRRLERNVHPAPDWNGVGGRRARASAVKGVSLSFREGEERRLAFTIENDWLALENRRGLLLTPKSEAGVAEGPIVITSQQDGRLRVRSPLKADKEEVVFEFRLSDDKGRETRAICRLPRSRPYVEIRPVEGPGEFFIQRAMRFVVIPDRFANDLRIAPAKYATTEVALPASPFVLGFPSAGESMLMLITPSPRQTLTAMVKEGVFSGMRVASGGESFFVCLVPGAKLWHEPDAQADIETGVVKMDSSYPCAGKWRVGLFGERNHSLMIDAKRFSQLKSIEGFGEPVESALVYLYGRSRETPLDVLTPEDLLRDALGIQGAAALLDLDGLMGYRTAVTPVPLHALQSPGAYSTYPNRYTNPQNPDNIPWRKFVQPRTRTFSLLIEFLGGGDTGGINAADQVGLNSMVTHVCDDIVNLLQGLDQRADEYEEFLSGLRQLCRAEEQEGDAAIELAETTRKDIENLRQKLAAMPEAIGIAEVEKHIQEIKGLLGSGGWLGHKPEFVDFAEVCLSALSQRQDLLAEHRGFAKRMRDRAGLVVPQKPELKDIAEKIRDLTWKVLRNRYYLEGDWRGESVREERAQ